MTTELKDVVKQLLLVQRSYARSGEWYDLVNAAASASLHPRRLEVAKGVIKNV